MGVPQITPGYLANAMSKGNITHTLAEIMLGNFEGIVPMTLRKQPVNIPQDSPPSQEPGKYKILYRVPKATINYEQFLQNRK